MAHPLANYFERNPNVSRGDFCTRAEISRMTLSRLMRGKGEYSTTLLRRISEATGGAVTVLELVAVLEGGEKRPKLARAS